MPVGRWLIGIARPLPWRPLNIISTILAWQLGAIGFLGSYTTVSSFSLQTLSMLHDRKWRAAAANTPSRSGSASAAQPRASGWARISCEWGT
jgi:fluoride ion exporter CrcB/FEX